MKYDSYILSDDKQRWERIYRDTNYNSLDDIPIKNMYGQTGHVIDISALDAGNYQIHGYYQLNPDSNVMQIQDALSVSVFKDEQNNRLYAVTYEIADDSVSQKVITFDDTTKEIIKEQTISVDDALIQDIDDSVTALEASITEANQDIADINTTLDSHEQSIGNINSELDSHTDSITDINTLLDSHETNIDNINNTLNSHEESIDDINITLSQHTQSIGTINDTLVAHQDDIDSLENDVNLLNNSESTQGSVRYTAKSYVDALDSVLASVAKSGSADDVSVSSENLQADDVEEALDELSDKIDTAQTSSQITVTRAQTPDGNDAATYIISQGGVEKGKISIAKDLVATNGELVEEDGSGNPGMFIKMTVANGTPFYIPVDELIDIYQGSGDVGTVNSGVEVKVTSGIISASIKTVEGAKIDNLSVSLAKLTQTLQDKIGLIDSAVFNIYEGATNGTISVDNQEVSVHGLKSAAYTEASAYDASGAADAVKAELLGDAQTDTASSKTIEGLVKKTDGIVEDVIELREDVDDAVSVTLQNFTEEQKLQARNNIGAVSEDDFDDSNSWKSEGTEGNILTKNSEGNLSWIELPKNNSSWTVLERPVYGVTWDYNNPSTKLTRIGDASNFSDPVPATSNSEIGSSPFDDIYPWSEMKMYNVENGEITASQDDVGFSFSKDTVVKIPEFYYKVEKDTDAQTHSWSICGGQKKGYKKHPGSGKYIGRYHMSGSSAEVFSKTGAVPLTNITRANARTYAKAKGEHWRMLDAATWSAFQMLYLIEFADWNSQETLGDGNNQTSLVASGGTDVAKYGILKCINADNQYRYVEDFDSNVVNFIDGLVFSNRVVYASDDPSTYGDTISGFQNLNITLPTSNGYISKLAYNSDYDYLFIPNSVTNGSDSTYVSDYLVQDNGVLSYYSGGRNDAFGTGGIFYFGASASSSATHNFFGSRLIYDPS